MGISQGRDNESCLFTLFSINRRPAMKLRNLRYVRYPYDLDSYANENIDVDTWLCIDAEISIAIDMLIFPGDSWDFNKMSYWEKSDETS